MIGQCIEDTIGAPGHLTLENIGGAPYTSEFVGGHFQPSMDPSSLNYSPLLSGGGKKKKRKSKKLKKSNKSRLVSRSKKSKSKSNKKVYKRKSLSKKMFRKKSKKSRKSLK
tara:strand:+ start:1001 stop:1333 length:333 start_codon:yes stop_codon:yes gene_type:complete